MHLHTSQHVHSQQLESRIQIIVYHSIKPRCHDVNRRKASIHHDHQIIRHFFSPPPLLSLPVSLAPQRREAGWPTSSHSLSQRSRTAPCQRSVMCSVKYNNECTPFSHSCNRKRMNLSQAQIPCPVYVPMKGNPTCRHVHVISLVCFFLYAVASSVHEKEIKERRKALLS